PAKKLPLVTSPARGSLGRWQYERPLSPASCSDEGELDMLESSEADKTQPCVKSPFQLALDKGHLEIAKILSDVCCFTLRSPGLSIPLAMTVNPMARRFSCLDEVKSLKQLCRKVIRQELGFELVDSLPKLPLPAPLKDYLLLIDINWSLYQSGFGAFADQAVLVRSSRR
ncbi:hypothetical protein Ciccas_010099, partial [Cichlidogyrus casuarinus]